MVAGPGLRRDFYHASIASASFIRTQNKAEKPRTESDDEGRVLSVFQGVKAITGR